MCRRWSAQKPELEEVEPFKTVLSGNREAMAKLSMQDLEKILVATLTGMTVEEFNAEVEEVARDGQGSALEAALYRADLSADAGGAAAICAPTATRPTSSPAAARTSCASMPRQIYGIPPEQVVGTAGGTKYGYDKDGKPFLTKEPKLLLNDNNAGKPEGIHLMIGRRPIAAFGNSTGDRQMLEYTKAGDGARLTMLVLHDDAAARICLRAGAGPARHQGRHLHPGALRRGEEERLDRDQHEERLEGNLSAHHGRSRDQVTGGRHRLRTRTGRALAAARRMYDLQ